MNTNHPTVTLKNGLRVANFSSPHAFYFDDGSVLPAVSEELCKRLSLDQIEREYKRYYKDGLFLYTDIVLRFEMNSVVDQALSTLLNNSDVDIVLVPFPVMEAWKNQGNTTILNHKIKVVRVKDRVSKVIYSDRFCI